MDFVVGATAAFSIFLASFFATVSGFGFALIATPLLAMVLPLKTVIVLVLVITLVLRFTTMYRTRRDFHWGTVATTTLGCILGMVPGSLVLKYIGARELQLFLSVVLLLATLLMSLEYTLKIKNVLWGRLGAGFLSGFFGSATSVGGPPLVLYFLNEHTEKTLMRANMIWIFGLSSTFTLLVYYLVGNIADVDHWEVLLPMLPAVFVGIFLGEKFFHILNPHLFRRLSLIVVCCGAIAMLVESF